MNEGRGRGILYEEDGVWNFKSPSENLIELTLMCSRDNNCEAKEGGSALDGALQCPPLKSHWTFKHFVPHDSHW